MKQELFTSVTVEGSILPADLLARVAGGDARLEGLRAEDYGLVGERPNEAASHAWARLNLSWAAFRDARGRLAPDDPGARLTLDKWLLPLFSVLGYGRLERAAPPVIDDKPYPVSHLRYRSPIHLVGFRDDLDRRAELGGRRASPHGLVQEFLNRSPDHRWGFVSNGLRLRVLRDSVRLSRQAYVEFDLEAMFDGQLYADFALLWRLCHESRVAGERPEACWLERWSQAAAEQGLRALAQLRAGVEEAVKALGRGFLACPDNAPLKDALKGGLLTPAGYYRELLRVAYRLLFLFIAEDRSLLLDPAAGDDAQERYRRFYSAARVRTVAETVRGTPHADLYEGLSLVLHRLGTDGYPPLALPALGGLFEPARTPWLAPCRLANADLLDAVRALTVLEAGGARRAVDYRNLGAEELGSVYESLLELRPTFDRDAGTFALVKVAGNERKTTGSYYTPAALIACLLDSALDPVLDEAARRPDAEAAILALRICDPACGSGDFLIAAANRVAKRLAAVRTHEDEPAPGAVRRALRDVIGGCVYGVDLNPMAVELCQFSLWVEGLDPGRPLSFLDHHVQCGNALLGATPDLIRAGVPDGAFEPIEGDVKAVAAAWKRQNAAERRGQGDLFDEARPWEQLGHLTEALAKIEGAPCGSIAAERERIAHYERMQTEAEYRTSGRFLADLWCAAFVQRKVPGNEFPITTAVLNRVRRNPHDAHPLLFAEVRRLAARYEFFHWEQRFAPVMKRGGFDVVLGNPPWERIKLQEQEWFATHGRPDIAGAKTASLRGKMIAKLDEEAPALLQAFRDDRRAAEGESHLVRDSSGIDAETGARRGRYPLCGRGEVNTYSLFAELNRTLISPTGRVGCIVPSGIATDDTTKLFFQDLVEERSLASLYDFENRDAIFPGVHRSYKFALLTLTGPDRPADAAQFVFFAHRVEDLADTANRFTLSPADLKLLNPNTRTCPVFRSARDAELTKGIYDRVPVLLPDGGPGGNPWGVRFMAMLHMANDSGLFKTAAELLGAGLKPEGNAFRGGDALYLPLYEAKLLHQYDHRWATYAGGECRDATAAEKQDAAFAVTPRYWVPAAEVADRLKGRWDRGWLLGWRDIARNTDVRTTIAGILPRAGVGHTAPLMLPKGEPIEVACLYASLCSFVFDYVSRQKIGGTHLTFSLLNQLPVLSPSTYAAPCPWDQSQTLGEWIRPRVLELTYTAHDLKPFAVDCGYDGKPFIWDDDRRAAIRAELDAAFFHLYEVSEGDATYILDTFPIVKAKDSERFGQYGTQNAILTSYRAMRAAIDDTTEATRFASSLTPPPGVRVPTGLFGTPLERSRRVRVIAAFVATAAGHSSEYAVCDGDTNRRYLAEVRRTVPGIAEVDANRDLWNARRSGQLAHLPPSLTHSVDPRLKRYEFVVEWAYRHVIATLEQESQFDGVLTLERVLCVPEWRQRFDDLVGKLMAKAEHKFTALDYRFTAMSVRKRVERVATALPPTVFGEGVPIAEAESRLPKSRGVYLIRSGPRRLYTGWAENLQWQVTYLRQAAGDGGIVPGWLLEGHGPPRKIAFEPLPDRNEGQLHDQWRQNLGGDGERPLLNMR